MGPVIRGATFRPSAFGGLSFGYGGGGGFIGSVVDTVADTVGGVVDSVVQVVTDPGKATIGDVANIVAPTVIPVTETAIEHPAESAALVGGAAILGGALAPALAAKNSLVAGESGGVPMTGPSSKPGNPIFGTIGGAIEKAGQVIGDLDPSLRGFPGFSLPTLGDFNPFEKVSLGGLFRYPETGQSYPVSPAPSVGNPFAGLGAGLEKAAGAVGGAVKAAAPYALGAGASLLQGRSPFNRKESPAPEGGSAAPGAGAAPAIFYTPGTSAPAVAPAPSGSPGGVDLKTLLSLLGVLLAAVGLWLALRRRR